MRMLRTLRMLHALRVRRALRMLRKDAQRCARMSSLRTSHAQDVFACAIRARFTL
jgi:hypothetical protein